MGLPTTIIDVYNTQDISEHGEPPYWTMMLRPDELQIVAVGDPAAVREPLAKLNVGPVLTYDAEGRPAS